MCYCEWLSVEAWSLEALSRRTQTAQQVIKEYQILLRDDLHAKPPVWEGNPRQAGGGSAAASSYF